MPVQYSNMGLIASHHWTREKASIFDVSHMLQTRYPSSYTRWTGQDKTHFLESLVVADLAGLAVGHSTLSLFTNAKGGIIDDTVINKQSDDAFYVVSNAGCAAKDLVHIRAHLAQFKGDVKVDVLDQVSLVALQGPSAVKVVENLSGLDLTKFAFMSARHIDIAGIPCYVSRCGYTGEDGFEISVTHEKVVALTEALLAHADVELAGLGARDSLRLEAGTEFIHARTMFVRSRPERWYNPC